MNKLPEGYNESPKPESKSEFMDLLDKRTYILNDAEYRDATTELFGRVPLSGVCLNISIARNDKFESIGYALPSIMVNKDYYALRFDEDYSDMIPYDIEHEKQETYFAVKTGFNPDTLDIKEGVQNRFFGRSHRLAVRSALQKANDDGNLNRYLEWNKKQFQSFEEMGIRGPMQEYALVEEEAQKIRDKIKSLP